MKSTQIDTFELKVLFTTVKQGYLVQSAILHNFCGSADTILFTQLCPNNSFRRQELMKVYKNFNNTFTKVKTINSFLQELHNFYTKVDTI